MNTLVRNLSLVCNVLLVVSLAGVTGILWKTKAQQAAVREEALEGHKTIVRYESFINSVMAAGTYVGLPFPKLDLQNLEGEPISTDFSGRKGALVLLFKAESCEACLVTQLKTLQRLHDVLEDPGQFPILGISSAPVEVIQRFARAFGLEYDLAPDSEGILVDDRGLGRQTPAVFLVDANNRISVAHVPSPGKPEFSILFYNQIRSYQMERILRVPLDHERASFGLGKVPFVQVIRNDYDKGRVEDLLY